MKRFVPRACLTTRLQTALLLLAGCSFQKFDYLQEGGAGSGSIGGVSHVAGSGSQPGGSDGVPQGGQAEPGAAGKANSSGGHAGKGGESIADAGDGNPPEGPGGAAGATNGGTDARGELVNPSFETGNLSGWQVDPADALTKKHAYVQWPQGGGSVPDGNNEFSTWHKTDAFTVELHQTIGGLADGTYTFKGYFSRGSGLNEAVMFARNCGGAVDPEPVPIPLTDPTQWLAVSLSGIEVSGGDCEVGLRVDSNPENWLNADLFSFEKDPE